MLVRRICLQMIQTQMTILIKNVTDTFVFFSKIEVLVVVIILFVLVAWASYPHASSTLSYPLYFSVSFFLSFLYVHIHIQKAYQLGMHVLLLAQNANTSWLTLFC
ncbi:hypothetical protein ACJX0J_022192 [Zea mays]